MARRLNLVTPGYRTLVLATAAKAEALRPPSMEALAGADRRWTEPAIWLALKRLSRPVTPDFLLAAVDLEEGETGIRRVEPDRAIYIDVLWRTVEISLSVCALCLLLGLPLAFLIASKARWANVLMTFVLLPFWMSLLARTAAWVALLQSQGLINKLLVEFGMVAQPLALMFNRAGVLIAMTHILLPYMVLPLYATMRDIPIELIRAGLSLGAGPLTVVRRNALVLPGITAGSMLVTILALGYYITPALVGGTQESDAFRISSPSTRARCSIGGSPRLSPSCFSWRSVCCSPSTGCSCAAPSRWSSSEPCSTCCLPVIRCANSCFSDFARPCSPS